MRFIKWLIGVFAVLMLILAIAPIGARFYALHWLKAQGYDAQIDTISYNVFNSRLTIAGLDVRSADKGGFKVELLETRLAFEKLPQKAWVLSKLKTQGLHIDVAKLEPQLGDVIEPIERFATKYFADWHFEIANSLNENIALCRKSDAQAKQPISQCLNIDSASFSDASLQNTARGWQFVTRSSAHFQGVYFKDNLKNASLMYIGDLKIRDVLADSTERRISQITANDFHLVETDADTSSAASTPYQTQLDSLLMNDIVATHSANESRIQISLIDIVALRQTLHKDRNSALVILERLNQALPSLQTAIDAVDSSSVSTKKTVVEVLKTRIIDGGVAWLDDSVEPPATASLTGLSFELGAISSSRPSDRSPVTFIAKLGDSGEVFAQGKWAVFSANTSFNLEGHIRGLDLARISAYTETLFAEKITSGRMDAKFRIDVASGQVRGDSSVRFSTLTALGGSSQNGVMSLQNSFNKLKTKNQDVDFDMFYSFTLPPTGSLGESLGKEAKRTLSAVANGQAPHIPASDKTTSNVMKFDTLKFSPNEETLTGSQELQLRDIVDIAKENPTKRLMLCNVTTGGEWAVLYRKGKTLKSWEQVPSVEQEHLKGMSLARTKFLVKQLTDAGLNKGQLHLCEPTIDLDDTGPSYLSASLE